VVSALEGEREEEKLFVTPLTISIKSPRVTNDSRRNRRQWVKNTACIS